MCKKVTMPEHLGMASHLSVILTLPDISSLWDALTSLKLMTNFLSWLYLTTLQVCLLFLTHLRHLVYHLLSGMQKDAWTKMWSKITNLPQLLTRCLPHFSPPRIFLGLHIWLRQPPPPTLPAFKDHTFSWRNSYWYSQWEIHFGVIWVMQRKESYGDQTFKW